MARMKGIAPSRPENNIMKGLTRQEVFDRVDMLRQAMLRMVTERGATPMRVIAANLGVSYDVTRSYGNYLVSIDAITRERIGNETFYTATGNPYKTLRNSTEPKAVVKTIVEPSNPHARTIRLLDRKPHEISKQEHDAARRSSRMSSRGSSMSMFDGF